MPQNPAVQQPLTPLPAGGSGPNRIGEFTRSFGKGDLAAPQAPPPLPSAKKEPGEFTKMFQAPGANPTASPVSKGVQPAAPAAAPPAIPTVFPASSPVSPPPTGPGEYTRQFSAPPQLTLGQTAATPPTAFAPPPMPPSVMASPGLSAPSAPPAKKTNLPLILGVVGIVVLAALIIVFFAMRPK
jgi:hypothetical protein